MLRLMLRRMRFTLYLLSMKLRIDLASRMGSAADLEAAMDVLASQVAAETFPDPRLRRLVRNGRRLTVGVLSTKVTGGFP